LLRSSEPNALNSKHLSTEGDELVHMVGISRSSMAATLEVLKMPIMIDKVHSKELNGYPLVWAEATSMDSLEAETMFGLVAKETHTAVRRVRYCALNELARVLCGGEEDTRKLLTWNGPLFIWHFYSEGSGPVYVGKERSDIEWFIMNRVRNAHRTLLLGDASHTLAKAKLGECWSAKFVAFLRAQAFRLELDNE